MERFLAFVVLLSMAAIYGLDLDFDKWGWIIIGYILVSVAAWFSDWLQKRKEPTNEELRRFK